jgi:hypothetical protein
VTVREWFRLMRGADISKALHGWRENEPVIKAMKTADDIHAIHNPKMEYVPLNLRSVWIVPFELTETALRESVVSENQNSKHELKTRYGDQQLPSRNDHPCIQDMVIADIEARKAVGQKRYGTVLQPFNGRNALRDAYEEAIDLAVYLRQCLYEQEHSK